MLIKKLYKPKNLPKRLDLYNSGDLETAFQVFPSIFLVCECRFWMSPNKILVIIVDIESKETMNGYNMIDRNLNEKEKNNLRDKVKCYFSSLPERKLIYIYDE